MTSFDDTLIQQASFGPAYQSGPVRCDRAAWIVARPDFLRLADVSFDHFRALPGRVNSLTPVVTSPAEDLIFILDHRGVSAIDVRGGNITCWCTAASALEQVFETTADTEDPSLGLYGPIGYHSELRQIVCLLAGARGYAWVWIDSSGQVTHHLDTDAGPIRASIHVRRGLAFHPFTVGEGATVILDRSRGLVACLQDAASDRRLGKHAVHHGSFSPDGTMVALGTKSGLAVWNHGRGVVEWIDEVPLSCVPTWSPDGRSIAYVCDGVELRRAVHEDGGWVTESVIGLVDAEGVPLQGGPVYSRDSRYLVASLARSLQKGFDDATVSVSTVVVDLRLRTVAMLSGEFGGVTWAGDLDLPPPHDLAVPPPRPADASSGIVPGEGFRAASLRSSRACWSVGTGGRTYVADLGFSVFRRVPCDVRSAGTAAWSARDRALYYATKGLARVDPVSGSHAKVCTLEAIVRQVFDDRRQAADAREHDFVWGVRYDESSRTLAGLLIGGPRAACVWLDLEGNVVGKATWPWQGPAFDVHAGRGVCFAPRSDEGPAAILDRDGRVVARLECEDPRLAPGALVMVALHPRDDLVALGTKTGLAQWDYVRDTIEWIDEGGRPCTPTWAPEGDSLAYSQGGLELRVATRRGNAWHHEVLARRLVGLAVEERQRPVFSHDGEVVFASLTRPLSRPDGRIGLGVKSVVVDRRVREVMIFDNYQRDVTWIGDADVPLLLDVALEPRSERPQ